MDLLQTKKKRKKKCIEMLIEHLNQYDISLKKHIVTIIIDGPNMMLKVRKKIEAIINFVSLGIHLAICDTLYYNKQSTEPETSSNKEVAELCY